ncbi:Outer membrane receptor for ferrienterochelin and colicins [Chryseobacterium arachidis]|uniref:Outer membrane receptor for ferrienterochelin and colicins n=1 Tax=Chryseobacterium arachidis TaxID=1416778 RepID=A0A1M5MVE3_9FLAO|nr:TonB-dependent receptor [Chryseobacterium arachidis]SHG81294.1 Outer membrane receptor for ferrienterochelin and colicins [Chryseobacterium arachidis]
MVRIFILIFVWLITLFSSLKAQTAQNFSLSGKIDSDKINQMEINLFDAENKLVKTEIADQKGNFSFSNLGSGNYSIKINNNGTEAYKSENISLTGDTTLPSIHLNEKSIEAVTITKTKPYIERQDGKMILNVENSIAATGNSAFEVLEKAPGVNIDSNDNISLRGKGNLLVQIDGKNTPMTGTDLANYLRGIPSSTVEKIEFITNPSSKYDAAGTSIINVKLKKDQRKGTNGSLSTSLGTGKFIKNNNSFNINHRNKKVNLFANYSFAYREFYNQLILDRNFYDNGTFTNAYVQDNFLKMNFRNHIAKAGMDYYANDKNIIGFSVGFISNRFNPTSTNETQVLNQNYQPAGSFITNSNNRDHWKNASINFNHKYKIDSLGSELTTDLDYINYSNASLQNFNTRNFDVNGNFSSLQPNPYILKGDLDGNLNIYSAKSDLIKVFKNNWKLETGLKTSFVKADNDLQYFDASSGIPVTDLSKTNHFIYEENINAAYGNVIKNWDKFKVNFGIRVENTNVTGNQLMTNQINKKNYTQLFPSAVFSYDLNDKNTIELNFSRRITRPTYKQLNPFKFYLDPTTYQAGNPDLNPQTTMNYEFTYSLSNKYFATLSYSKTENNITDVLKPTDENGNIVVVQAVENLSSADYYGLNLIAPVKVTQWWDMNNNANFYYGTYTGNIADTYIKNQGNFTFNINSINSFKIGNGFSAELSGNYQAKQIYAYMHLKPMWSVNIGAQKKFKNNSTLKFSFNDIFFKSNPEARNIYSNYIENFIVRRDTRVATLSYTYNFGSGKSGQARKTGGADDLKQRVGN